MNRYGRELRAGNDLDTTDKYGKTWDGPNMELRYVWFQLTWKMIDGCGGREIWLSILARIWDGNWK